MKTDELIHANMDLAQNLAKKKKRTIPRVYYEDLEAAAYHGLVDAANNYKPEFGEFRTYAPSRICGEINDYLRELGWGSRRNRVEVLPLDPNIVKVEKEEVPEVMERLPKAARELLTLYYGEGLTVREIGERLGISKSSVHQKIDYYKNQVRAIITCC